MDRYLKWMFFKRVGSFRLGHVRDTYEDPLPVWEDTVAACSKCSKKRNATHVGINPAGVEHMPEKRECYLCERCALFFEGQQPPVTGVHPPVCLSFAQAREIDAVESPYLRPYSERYAVSRYMEAAACHSDKEKTGGLDYCPYTESPLNQPIVWVVDLSVKWHLARFDAYSRTCLTACPERVPKCLNLNELDWAGLEHAWTQEGKNMVLFRDFDPTTGESPVLCKLVYTMMLPRPSALLSGGWPPSTRVGESQQDKKMLGDGESDRTSDEHGKQRQQQFVSVDDLDNGRNLKECCVLEHRECFDDKKEEEREDEEINEKKEDEDIEALRGFYLPHETPHKDETSDRQPVCDHKDGDASDSAETRTADTEDGASRMNKDKKKKRSESDPTGQCILA